MAADAHEMQRTMVGLAERAGEIDIRRFEEGQSATAIGELHPAVTHLLDESLSFADKLLAAYDTMDDRPPSAPPPPDSELAPDRPEQLGEFFFDIDQMVSEAQAPNRVADIAFMVATELRQKRQALAALHEGMDCWEIVAQCGSACRRIRKSLTALELVLCETEGLEPALGFSSELTTSLEIRRRYAELREAILAGGDPTESSLVRRLRAVGTQIAMLVGRDVYTSLRVHDRIQIRRLQARILEWLRGGDGADPREGLRLWQDLIGFAGMLAQVSRRQELVEHDTALVDEALAILSGPSIAEVPETLLARLETLRGLDDESDKLLRRQTRQADPWRDALQRLRLRLGPAQGFGGAPQASPRSPETWT